MIFIRSFQGWVLTGLELHIRESDIPYQVALEERVCPSHKAGGSCACCS